MYSATEVVIMITIQTVCNYVHFMRLMRGAVGRMGRKVFQKYSVGGRGQVLWHTGERCMHVCLFIYFSFFESSEDT